MGKLDWLSITCTALDDGSVKLTRLTVENQLSQNLIHYINLKKSKISFHLFSLCVNIFVDVKIFHILVGKKMAECGQHPGFHLFLGADF